MNELLWIGYIIINYTLILLAYKLWGKIGLFIFIPISIIIANIQVIKLMYLFGVDTTMGNVAYSGIFIVEDILSENYGKEVAKKSVGMGFFAMIFTTIIMTIAINIRPALIDVNNEHLKAVFTSFGRLTIASLTAYTVSSLTDINLYQFIRKFFPSYKNLWIRNNVSTLLSQVMDNVVFVLVAFYGTYNWSLLLSIMFSTYFLKIIISVLDTPFVYIASYMKRKNMIKEI